MARLIERAPAGEVLPAQRREFGFKALRQVSVQPIAVRIDGLVCGVRDEHAVTALTSRWRPWCFHYASKQKDGLALEWAKPLI